MTEEALPNIILLLLDATRADRLSSYGYALPTTPHIDQIAREGTLYENAFAPDVWTLPVVSSLFTGQMPGQHQVDYDAAYLPDRIPTLASCLSEHGYETFGISAGSWISQATGLDRGFDSFVEPYRLIQTKTGFKPIEWLNRFYTKHIFWRHDKGANHITAAAERWLQQRQTAGIRRPFFMFLHYLEPHYPYAPPPSFAIPYFSGERELKRAQSIEHHPLDFFAGKVTLDEREFALLNRLYDGELAYTDHHVGRLYRKLFKLDLLSSTAIILLADHGENIGDHGLLDHHFCLYDTLLHVPLIIRHPARFPVGKRVNELVQSTDLFPTILQLADINMPAVSETPTLFPDEVARNGRQHIIAQTSNAFLEAIAGRKPVHDISRYDRDLWAVRTRRWKYIEGSDGHVELYNLEADSDETNNLAAEWPKVVARLKAILDSYRVVTEAAAKNQEKAPASMMDDPLVAEHLRSLGYMD